MTSRKRRPALCGLGLFLCALTGVSLSAETPRSSLEALDWGFRFGSAIDPDPSDKGLAQHSVVGDLARLGELDRAVELARQVEGWRRGIALADLATLLARDGREEEARRLIGEARGLIPSAKEWRGPRISAHIAQSLAALGELDAVRRDADRLATADARQYQGRAVATIAIATATGGDFDAAMAGLGSLDGMADLDLTVWRTNGYLELADLVELSREQRLQALDAARQSAELVAGAAKLEALQRVGKAYHDLGRGEQARESLVLAEKIVLGMPAELPVRAPLQSRVARAWAEIGESERAAELLAEAIPLVESAMVIERPGIIADFGASYLALGDLERATSSFDQALGDAESLVNARPRALAVVQICRSMAVHGGVEFDAELRDRLEKLYRSLRAPW